MGYSLLLALLLPVCVLSACSPNCATCENPFSNPGRYRCTSCYTGYALQDQTCYDCNYCSYYDDDVCSACGVTTTTSTSSSTTSLYGIIFGILGGIILVCVIIIFIYYRCKVYAINHEVRVANQGSDIALHDIPSLKWNVSDKHINMGQNCAICLQNNVNVLTKCGHLYHPKCIWEWCNKREMSCPLCKSHELQEMRVYCPRCAMNYVQVPINALPAMAGNVKFISCGQCNE